ncbi:hypothetical protein [Sphingobium sp.]|uniref:hypothetical protein n=1 Tax=Sphingobium sp. TaxID=1912891 RepID=UPI003B3B1415
MELNASIFSAQLSSDASIKISVDNFDWSAIALGARGRWLISLRTTVNRALASHFPMFVAWDDDLAFLYNDACAPFLGDRHPTAPGQPIQTVWSELWEDLEPLIVRVKADETM